MGLRHPPANLEVFGHLLLTRQIKNCIKGALFGKWKMKTTTVTLMPMLTWVHMSRRRVSGAVFDPRSPWEREPSRIGPHVCLKFSPLLRFLLATIVQKSIEEFAILIKINSSLGQIHSPSLPHHEERPQISSVRSVVDYIQPEGQSDSSRWYLRSTL